ncbi:MAG: restriction endonuclease subunit M [Ruminococcus flavefaciens]|nr:restriction endonuclease subunit M [Ruminococcus flavefaciens]
MEIDIFEDRIKEIDNKLLDLLLLDCSTHRNIVWATTDYTSYGESYSPECEITVEQITKPNTKIIRPRVTKSNDTQNLRIRDKAEVFTPSWICNAQNNLIDEQWFGRPNVFNTIIDKKWTPIKSKVDFPAKPKKTWQDYIRAKRMEITCGEAPYLVSRYDTVSGEIIEDVHKRIGLLDRKMRIVDENTDNETDWFMWTKKAYQSIYGFEFQGDNLLLARENLLFTFADYMEYKFGRVPNIKEYRQIAHIISWNIWQMDGLTYSAPYSDNFCQEECEQLTLFDLNNDTNTENTAVPCVIRDWTNKCYVTYKDLLRKGE